MIAAAVLCLAAAAAQAHDWYNKLRDPVTTAECCDGTHCARILASDVRLAATGYVVKTATTETGEVLIPFARVIPSEDGAFHKCEWSGEVKCFIAPPLGA